MHSNTYSNYFGCEIFIQIFTLQYFEQYITYTKISLQDSPINHNITSFCFSIQNNFINVSLTKFLNPLNKLVKTALNLCARSQSDYSAPVQIVLPNFPIEFVPNFFVRKYILIRFVKQNYKMNISVQVVDQFLELRMCAYNDLWVTLRRIDHKEQQLDILSVSAPNKTGLILSVHVCYVK
ncbi:Hypothetical_protein [Hexamita inflata]|uniref:Hypothetical_protein n=1 Tax=Hexamita inflata TaxID=28002 RepID=A0AA86RU60_9EUKA|nr:Hypothetical protein HINF_LOCUS65604 [Hexamita inflata]